MTKPLRIGLIMQGDRNWIGGTQYIKNIILALGSLPEEVRSTFELCLITSKSLDSSLYSEIVPYLKDIYDLEVDLEPLTLSNRLRWKLIETLLKQDNPRFDALIEKNNIDFLYPSFSQCGSPKSYRSAAWIADFQHKYLPQFFTESELRWRDSSYELTARHASSVVVSSKTAKADFQKFFPKAAHKSKVLSFKSYPPSEWYETDAQQIQKEYSLPDRFFLVSNQFWKHKNHLVIFKALKLLQEKSIYPTVICTGHLYDRRQPDYIDIVLQTLHQLDIAKQVYLLGLIPRLSQIQLMRRSLAVIQPSLFEGWSTVVEDARCLGKPIIVSDIPVHLEQNPPHSLLFERNSPESLASLLADWWEHLSPGPDPEQEAIAKTNNLSEVQAFGYRFLEIAKGS
ncbi:MAG TPA: glycosyltransferase family 1 protein [Coleofasciculaceae cyanobacterium]|jgi:glycosyltransferase involved in cell wall biosynthesis